MVATPSGEGANPCSNEEGKGPPLIPGSFLWDPPSEMKLSTQLRMSYSDFGAFSLSGK